MSHSIIEWFGFSISSSKCGYCKTFGGKQKHGMWAHSLQVEDYDDLLNRGWRRSGCYCYKPTMNKTCCPQYEIRCDVANFKLSKSQKKVIRKMKSFLLTGEGSQKNQVKRSQTNKINQLTDNEKATPGIQDSCSTSNSIVNESNINIGINNKAGSSLEEKKKAPTKGLGADPNRPKCVKAKQRRLEKKKQKNTGVNKMETTNSNRPLTLDDDLPHLHDNPGARHKLQARMVRSQPKSEEFNRTKQVSFELYKKYQLAVHDDKESDLTMKQWERFLVNSPLSSPNEELGSFHRQYWLDDKLIAVGVVDVLPTSVSSVYVYYDVDYNFLSLGVYTALAEIQLTHEYKRNVISNLGYYIMGYYIETCDKMRYKGAYSPSQLLCPETYQWVSLDKCRETLKVQKYARLNVLDGGSPTLKDNNAVETYDIVSLDKVLILYNRCIHEYSRFTSVRHVTYEERQTIHEYANLVGKTCSQRMLLYRSDI